VFDRVSAKTASEKGDTNAGQLEGYRAAQWTAFGFGLLGKLAILPSAKP
jgi:hypothetical protein